VAGYVDAKQKPQEQVCEISICRLLGRQHLLVEAGSTPALATKGGSAGAFHMLQAAFVTTAMASATSG
jgi:hypothetical protein